MSDTVALPCNIQVPTGGRRNGRSRAMRWAAEMSATAGEHTHFLARDGMWCVTRQPPGFVWSLVRRPGERCGNCGRVKTS
jgi:hypothetical protein